MRGTLEQDSLDISVVIPSLNEAPNLYRLVPLLREALETLDVTWEILIVDGDSQDGTERAVTRAGARYICEKSPGYGAAILRGIREARGEYVLTMDADLSHPTKFIQHLWAARKEADITIASRYVHGGHADQPMARYMLSYILNRFFAVGLSLDVKDLSSGYRLYRKALFDRVDLTFTNFVVLVEILLRAFSQGFHIQEVPFHYQPRGTGSSKAKIIKFGGDYLKLFFRIWRIRNSIEFPDYDWRAHNSRIPLQRYWQRKRHEIVLRFTSKMVSTCDVGCGSSQILASLPHAVGVDMRHDKLAFMRKTNKLLVQSNGMTLPFADESFECVISSQVIEHIPDENGRLIDELSRILEPDGILVLGTPDYDRWEWRSIEWLYGKLAPGAYGDEHVTFYSYKRLEEELRARGYEILDHEYILRGELIIQARKLESRTRSAEPLVEARPIAKPSRTRAVPPPPPSAPAYPT